MTTLPVRNLAERGVLLDPHPYDLPSNAFSYGTNVWFADGKASRAPIFRLMKSGLSADPTFCFGYRPASGYDHVMLGTVDGSITRYVDPTTTPEDITPTGRAPLASDEQWTGCFLGGVAYLNRPTHTPAAFLPAATRFVELPAWDPAHRCKSLRAYKDVLVAINVTKGSVVHPAMVKWSDVTLADQTPGSWDVTDLSTIANEVEIAQIEGGWIDGAVLRNAMVLYSSDQVWAMEYTGDNSDAGQNLFTFRSLFMGGGMIARNCAVEVEGKHFVFGENDLYVHDGTSMESLADERVRSWVYRYLVRRSAERCFVMHMPKYNRVIFAFPSTDPGAFFKNPTRCNRAAVYNYKNNTWSLVDLPNLAAGTTANADRALTYDAPGSLVSFADLGGSFSDLEDGREEAVMFCASALPGSNLNSPRLLAYDRMDRGSLSFAYDVKSNAPALLERVGIDLDAEGSDLTTYKVVRRIYPQLSTPRRVAMQIQIGGAMTPSGPVNWGPKRAYDTLTQYKVDVRVGGRYLAMRVFADEPADFDFSGFDIDIVTAGRR